MKIDLDETQFGFRMLYNAFGLREAEAFFASKILPQKCRKQHKDIYMARNVFEHIEGLGN